MEVVKDINQDQFYFDWLKTQEQKIQVIEKNIISLTKELQELKK